MHPLRASLGVVEDVQHQMRLHKSANILLVTGAAIVPIRPGRIHRSSLRTSREGTRFCKHGSLQMIWGDKANKTHPIYFALKQQHTFFHRRDDMLILGVVDSTSRSGFIQPRCRSREGLKSHLTSQTAVPTWALFEAHVLPQNG
jgi:hypothetical protein